MTLEFCVLITFQFSGKEKFPPFASSRLGLLKFARNDTPFIPHTQKPVAFGPYVILISCVKSSVFAGIGKNGSIFSSGRSALVQLFTKSLRASESGRLL